MKIMALFFALGFAAPSVSAQIEPYEYFLCSNKNFVRTLRIEILEDKSCEAKYSKGGIDKVVGSGIHISSCQKFLNNVKENLIQAGWDCKKLDSVKMSASQ